MAGIPGAGSWATKQTGFIRKRTERMPTANPQHGGREDPITIRILVGTAKRRISKHGSSSG